MCPGVWGLRYGGKITRKSEACSQNGKKNVIIYEIIFSFFLFLLLLLLLLLLLTVQFCISTSQGTLDRPCVTIVDPGGGIRARKRPKHAPNHQILLCLPSMPLTPSFPTDNAIVKCYISTSHGTLDHPFGTVGDPWGAVGGPLLIR